MKLDLFHPSRWLTWLAIGSWLPLAAALLAFLFSSDTANILHITIAYAAALLCFLGGVRLGAALMGSTEVHWLVRLVPLVALLGLVALYLPQRVALAVLMVGYAAQGALDVWAGMQGRLPGDYADARALMTWLCALTLLGILMLNGWA